MRATAMGGDSDVGGWWLTVEGRGRNLVGSA